MMNIKNIVHFALFALLCSACFKHNLQMGQEEDKKQIGIENNRSTKKELQPGAVYDEFVSLVDDPEVCIDEIVQFLDEDNRIQCLLKSGLPFVHYVVESGEYELLEAMLEKYDKHDLANYKGGEWQCTPLHTAARAREGLPMVQLLLKKHARIDEVDFKGSTVVDYVCYNTTATDIIDIFKAIFDKCPIPIKENGCTALHVATLANNISLIKYLIATYPTMLNVKSKDGLTALHLSVGLGYTDIFKIIIQNQAFDKNSISQNINDLLNIAEKRKNQFMIAELQNLL